MIEEIESISSMRKEAQSRVPPAFAVRQIAVRQATSKFVHHRVIVYSAASIRLESVRLGCGDLARARGKKTAEARER